MAVYHHTSKTLLTALLLFCAALLLSAYTKERPAIARLGASLLGECLRPFQILHGATRHGLAGLWERYLYLIETERENERLKGRLAVLEAQNSQLAELKKENLRLRGLLQMSQDLEVQLLAANVIGHDPSNWVQVITIDKGRRDGVRIASPVLEKNGVVGQVISLGNRSARVLLLSDRTSGVDALVQGSRARGILEGRGRFACRLNYVSVDEEVKIGDRVITSGLDKVFPKGLLLGVVSSLDNKNSGELFREIEVRASVDFVKLETVAVLLSTPKRPLLD